MQIETIDGVECVAGPMRDGRGRKLSTLVEREALLDAFERSGMNGAKFARRNGLKYGTFAHWVQARRRGKATNDVAFREVQLAPQEALRPAAITKPTSSTAHQPVASPENIEVVLPSGLIIRIVDGLPVAKVTALVHALLRV